MWNYINYLHCELTSLKDKHENLVNHVREIIEAVKQSEMKRLEEKNKHKKSKTKCRFFNRGYCKEGQSCDFFHPIEIFDSSGNNEILIPGGWWFGICKLTHANIQ